MQTADFTAPPRKSAASHWLDSWHVDPSANREYDFIDGLRGVAILMVLCCHHIYINPASGRATHFFGAFFAGMGGSGLTLFFVISGFLISWPFWKRKFGASHQTIPSGYAKRRFFKIYPPLALSVIGFTTFFVLARRDFMLVPIAAKWLAGIPFLLPVSGKLNPVMWTLVLEVQFYITLPFVFLAFRSLPARFCLWAIPLLFFAVPTAYHAWTGLQPTFAPEINAHFPSGLDAFCLGVLLAALDTSGSLGKGWNALGIPGVLLMLAALLIGASKQLLPSMQAFPDQVETWMERIASFFLLCQVADSRSRMAGWLDMPWLRWCGIISYEWYLFHQPIVLWARYAFGPAEGHIPKYVAIVGGSFLFSGILSAMIYRCFSLPILKFGRSAGNKTGSRT